MTIVMISQSERQDLLLHLRDSLKVVTSLRLLLLPLRAPVSDLSRVIDRLELRLHFLIRTYCRSELTSSQIQYHEARCRALARVLTLEDVRNSILR